MSTWDKLLFEIVLVSRMLDKMVIILDEESLRVHSEPDVILLLNPCFGMQLIVEGVNPDTRAVTMRAYKVCNSYLYILDQVLLPTRRNDLTAIPEVNATFLQALALRRLQLLQQQQQQHCHRQCELL